MDEIVRHLQGCLKKIALDRLGSVSMWMGVARRSITHVDRYQIMQMTGEAKLPERTQPTTHGAEIIEFYVPLNFVRPVRWIPEWRCGKVLQFRPRQKKTA